ncbi:hypothetical protein [Kitasatospora sp. NPDC047058]|uniref:hypothetical protein n=1 Tax=Kitasatospora sp. NPDC047058 TaxID=3155620 RepID=UPI0033D0D812
MQKEGDAPLVGKWKSSVGTIQFLDGGTLGEVSLLPATCRGSSSPTELKFTGTWRPGKVEDAGRGAFVELASVTDGLKCDTYFQYFKYNDEERLQLTDIDGAPFVRQ